MDTTGKLCDSATGGSGGTSATYGAAFPSTGTPAGGTDGTNFQPLVVDTTTHYLQVDVKAGGAGGGAVYGPTAAGSAAANPPVLMGGTIDGTATGNVDNWKVLSGVGYVNAVNSGTFAVQATQAGNWTARMVGNAGGLFDAVVGAAAPANAVQIGGSDGTDLRAWLMSNTGQGHVLVDNSASPVSPGNGISAPTGTPPSVSQPTTSFNEMYNGTTWDAQQDDANKNLKVAQQATPTGGASTTGNIAANNTTAVVLKSSAGTVYGVQVYGIGSAPAYLKLYNATSETCGSGTPVKRLMIPAAPTAADGAGSNVTFGPQGIAFGTGITYCVTTGITDSDTTAPAASMFLVNVDWD
jgi:hypothetical protein